MNELAGQSLGGYQLEEEIGHGSMGVVYRGKQIALGREVAIKVLPKTLARDASYVARFIREAQIIAGLNHPNIVQIYDAGQQSKLLYFVMEYVQGPTLSNLLHLDGTIPQHLAVEYAAQIAEALDAAYRERNVIHRDIKPENLMLNRWGKVKVMDFGLARALGHQKITVAKTLVGSIYYASPEQVWGENLDNRSDIYALGVVLYEMVTGQRPFTGRSMPELTQAIVHGNPPPPSTHNPTITYDVEQIIMQALSLHREQRYADANSMAQELRALHLKPVPPPDTPHTSAPHTHTQGQGQNRPIMQPPKRPQTQRPRYLDVDMEQTLPPPSAPMTPPSQHILYDQQQQASQRMNDALSSIEPVHYRHMSPSPYTPLPEDIKTASLESLQKPQPRRSFWGQIQKLFKLTGL
jgi:serine/threonine protein kinase